MEGRTVDVDDHLGASDRGVADRLRIPGVLADRDAHLDAADGADQRLVAGEEVALFVEDAVVGQLLLVVAAQHDAVVDDRRRVVEVVREVEAADDQRRQPDRVGGECEEVLLGFLDECRAQQLVLRRVAGDHQLRERDDVSAILIGTAGGGEDLLAVALEVPDGAVHLCQGDAQRLHGQRSRRPLRLTASPAADE